MPSKKSEAIMAAMKAMHKLIYNMDLSQQRQAQDRIRLLTGLAKKTTEISVDLDGMPCTWLRPVGAAPDRRVILYCHGGGYTVGTIKYAAVLASMIAAASGLDVFAYEYRLAPEHPYPAALEDTMKAWDYLLSLGYAPGEIAVAGESAGGGLTLALAMKLRDEGRGLPSKLVCISPWADLTGTGESMQTNKDVELALDHDALVQAAARYAGGYALTDPLISPVFGNFEGFPPTLIHVGGNEILLSDSETVFKKMTESGVPCSFTSWPEMWHVFQMFPVPEGKKAMAEIGAFLSGK